MFTGQDDRAYAAWKHAMEVYEPILTVGGRQFLAGRAVISEYFAICLRERLMLDKDASNARGRCLKAIEALRSAIADRDSAGRRNNAWALRRDLAECYLRLGDKNAAGVCCAELKQIEESLQSGGPLVSEIHKELLKLAAKIKSAH